MHYFERQFGLNATKLLPGEFYVTADDHVLTTVLGSCVAACILDTEAGIGGMNHFMLPDAGEGVVSGSARYGSYAMELLINDLLKAGARRGALAAKLFGGGNVLQSFTTNQVGTRNVEFVHAYLQAERIPVLAEDVLDVYPRKIFFFPRSGRALVRRLPPAVVAVDLADERAYGSRLRSEPVQGGVELFE
jgi:chemotaxis protein CheD